MMALEVTYYFVRHYLLMIRRSTSSTRTYTPFPNTTRFRSHAFDQQRAVLANPYQRAEFKRAVAWELLAVVAQRDVRSDEPTSELQSLMRISYAVSCMKKQQ